MLINYVYKYLYDAPKGQIEISKICKPENQEEFISYVNRAIKDRIGSNLGFTISISKDGMYIVKK